jgi:hypothetical protein
VYNATYTSDSGLKFVFGAHGSNVFDMDVGNGLSVELGTSQGIGQIGESVKTQSVTGRNIMVSGCAFGDIVSVKNKLRKTFAPFTSGTLVVNEKYFIRVVVKSAPTFSPQKNNGKFTMLLFAPFPYFYSVDEKVAQLGEIIPRFRFPVNYSDSHRFGTTNTTKYINVINDGDVPVFFSTTISVYVTAHNPTIVNVKTLQFLKINGTFTAGDTIQIYRNADNVLYAELHSGGETVNILGSVDEESNLFQLFTGDNLILADDEEGAYGFSVTLNYRTAVCAVYED